jgi:hypothetical protein
VEAAIAGAATALTEAAAAVPRKVRRDTLVILLFSFHLDCECMAVIAFEVRFALNAMAVGAVLFTAVVAVRIRIHLGCFLSYSLIGLMANQAIFCCCIVRKVGMHRRIFQLSLGAHAESGCTAECCGKAQKSLNFHMFSP